MELQVEVKVWDIVWAQFMLTLLMALFNYFPQNCLLSYKNYQVISKVSLNSLRESYQHTDNPFDIFGLLIKNFKISNGLSVC